MDISAPTTTGNYVRIFGQTYYIETGSDPEYFIMLFRPSNDFKLL
jgi:hypothetical protein